MADRHYLPASYPGGRPVYLADLGNTLKIAGIVVQGMGTTAILLTPSATPFTAGTILVEQPNLDEWGEIIRASDDPQVFVGEVGGVNKVLHRKVRHEISGFTQQKIWHRDQFICCYCQRGLPDVQLSCDHWLPLSEGGSSDDRNIITACKKCNKNKGDLHPQAFCAKHGFSYDVIAAYVRAL